MNGYENSVLGYTCYFSRKKKFIYGLQVHTRESQVACEQGEIQGTQTNIGQNIKDEQSTPIGKH